MQGTRQDCYEVNRDADSDSGFNKYYPPDYDGEKHKSLNAYRGKCRCTSYECTY